VCASRSKDPSSLLSDGKHSIVEAIPPPPPPIPRCPQQQYCNKNSFLVRTGISFSVQFQARDVNFFLKRTSLLEETLGTVTYLPDLTS
jgi:hypothetical protein